MNLSPGVMEKHEEPSTKFLLPACGRFSHMQLSLFESIQPEQCVRAGRFNFLSNYGAIKLENYIIIIVVVVIVSN